MDFNSFSNRNFARNWPRFVTGLVLLIVGAVVITGCKRQGSVLADTPNVRVADAPPQNSYAAVVSRGAPAVVTIRANRRVREAQQFPFADDPFFRGLFGNRGQQQP